MLPGIDPARTALIIIDLQEGIASGSIAPHDRRDIIRNSVALANALHAAGGLIVPVHVAFAADGGDRLTQPVDTPTPRPAGGLPANWSEFVPEIAALPAAFRITKHQWGAFHGTELDLQLRRRGTDTVIVVGISTNFGVEQTAREAWQHGYQVLIAEDACASASAEMHQFSVERIMPRIAQVRPTAALVEALSNC